MRRDLWFFIFALGAMCFGWPIISIFRSSLTTYLFFAWIVFIALIFIATTFSGRKEGGS